MLPVVFLSVEDVIEVHRRVIEEHGGDCGLRDRGVLESAVGLAQASFGGKDLHASVPEKAGAYFYHLCSNHSFVDGNKRVSLASSELFLLLNGHELQAGDDEIENLTVGVARGKVSKERVLEFFVEHAEPS